MNKKSAHLILIINPMVVLYLEDLLTTLDNQCNSTQDFYIIEFYTRKLLSDDKTINIKSKYNGRIHVSSFVYNSSFVKYLAYLYLVIIFIRKFVNNFEEINFYIAHPNHILTNYIFFELSKLSHISVNQIPDGIANYYNVNTDAYESRMFQKKILAFALGLKYYRYKGLYLGTDLNVFSKYYYYGISYANVNLLHQQSICSVALKKTNESAEFALLIGQDVSLDNSIVYFNIVEQIVICLSKRYGKVHYKPHPSEKLSLEQMARLTKHSCDVVNFDGIVEEIMYKYKVCVGFFSSSLFNGKIMHGDGLRVITIDGSFILSLLPFIRIEELNSLRNLFVSVGVEVLELEEVL